MTQREEPTKRNDSGSTGSSWLAAALRWLLPLILIGIAVLVFFNRLVFSNLILARGDTFLYFYPYWQAAADALSAGQLPLWNSQLFMGAPFLANSQVGLFYPLNWPFWLLISTPYAVSASIVLHVIIAGWGTYYAARSCLALSRSSAILSAVLFALGGYFTAQVEHINQLQGLAWLPWYFVAASWWLRSTGDRRSTARFIAAIAVLISLQLLAGHTQTVFISVFGLTIWMVSGYHKGAENSRKQTAQGLLIILAGALAALLITGIQVAPTLELLANSSRQGGISPREALSFSLHPLLVTRSLFPEYGSSFFTEYVAYLPLTALLLAVVGAWGWRKNPEIRALVIISAIGFLFALGIFNPIYQVLVRIPGFNLFRVPARWLVLYAFGISLLAGAGLQALISSKRKEGTDKSLIAGTVLIIALFAWALASVYLASYVTVGSEISIEYPGPLTWIGWGAELALAVLILFILSKRNRKLSYILLLLLVAVVLFSLSRTLPYNDPTTPEAYSDLRPPSTRLQAISDCSPTDPECELPTGRILSLSDIFFDPGDQAEIDTAYKDLLTESAQYDYTIAIKQKEIIAPDLSMVYGLQSVDGFDGGLLPLADYAALMDLILAEDKAAIDGRLREYLDAIPEARWMDLFNAKYLITDKVGDDWREGVFFDRQHPVVLDSENASIDVGFLPDFKASELWLISSAGSGAVDVSLENGDHLRLYPEQIGEDLYRVEWMEPSIASSLSLMACESESDEPSKCGGQWFVEAATLVDGRADVFMPIVLGNYRLIHSGDVKIYENLDVFPRAFLVNQWFEQPDVETSIEFMADPHFDPAESAVVVDLADGSTLNDTGWNAEVTDYEQEWVRLSVSSEGGGLLVLTDAYYPGWQAAIDGEPSKIYQTDGYFRGVMVPPGQHIVEFRYNPGTLSVGAAMTFAGIAVLLVLIVVGTVKWKDSIEAAPKRTE
jgi:hypothetical protein